jgi:hypothetical protein
MKKCATRDCENSAWKRDRFCPKCRSRHYKKTNPVGYFFNLLRCHARARGIDFTLTQEQFREFCIETSFKRSRSVRTKGYTVDRVKANEGYHIGNIQLLTHRSNSVKGMTLDRIFDYDESGRTQVQWRVTKRDTLPPPIEISNESPF